jgi:DNA (cytosine-5)-methyltransferase 1
MKPRLLDLFCGAGGAAMGYTRAGFEVVGVDIKSQPRYPFEFHQADAMGFPLHGFDVIHASPPCQRYSAMTLRWTGEGRENEHPDLVAPTRDRLAASGLPFVMENVEGAPLIDYAMLCGSMFGLGSNGGYLKRHRWFESNVWLWPPQQCIHVGPAIGVYGHSGGSSKRDPGRRFFGAKDWRAAMGIDWMTVDELAEAIPPAYTEWIGRQLLPAVEGAA